MVSGVEVVRKRRRCEEWMVRWRWMREERD